MGTKADPFHGYRTKEVRMLDAFIIDELKRRDRLEEDRWHDAEQPFLEIPVPSEEVIPLPASSEDPKPERGVIVIDFSV
ncbi:MAG TPA: hypothetical protein VGD74_05325 [Vulgatibacter sp.]